MACLVKSGGAGADAGAPDALSATKPVSLLYMSIYASSVTVQCLSAHQEVK